MWRSRGIRWLWKHRPSSFYSTMSCYLTSCCRFTCVSFHISFPLLIDCFLRFITKTHILYYMPPALPSGDYIYINTAKLYISDLLMSQQRNAAQLNSSSQLVCQNHKLHTFAAHTNTHEIKFLWIQVVCFLEDFSVYLEAIWFWLAHTIIPIYIHMYTI